MKDKDEASDTSFWEDPKASYKLAVPWKQINAQVDMKFPETTLVVAVDPSKGFDSAGSLFFLLLSFHPTDDRATVLQRR